MLFTARQQLVCMHLLPEATFHNCTLTHRPVVPYNCHLVKTELCFPQSGPHKLPCGLLQVVRWLTECGNGIVEGEEQCDDGNLESGDGCSPVCKVRLLV